MVPRLLGVVTTVIVGTLVPRPAMAHVAEGLAGGFLSGFGHPFSGWDHMVAMIAVGLWGAQLGAPAVWQLPVAFPLMMAVGGFLGLTGVPVPGVEIGIAVSALLLGLLVALAARPPQALALVVVAAFAIFHGHAHGAELAPGTNALAYSLGFVVATGCLHGLGIAVGLVHAWPVGARLIKGVGVLVALVGLVFLWRAVG